MDNMGEMGEMIRKEHFREEIDLISIGKLIVLLVTIWVAKMIMGIIGGGRWGVCVWGAV